MSSKENADFLLQYAQSQGIIDKKELANFMGQMQVESKNFTSFEESLHYSGKRLYEVFPERNEITSVAKADEIVKGGSEKIAEAVYGGQWGKNNLGNTEPGDGWRFHGRGYIQLTGRAQYANIGKELDLDLVNNPDLVANRDVAAQTAVQYWKENVTRLGRQENVDKTTRIINRGDEGLKERRAAAAAWEYKLEHGYVPGALEPIAGHTLKQGMHGDDVKHAQDELHELGYLQADLNGRFGPATKAATEDFQRVQGLNSDGKIGSITQGRLDASLQDHRSAVRDQQISDFTSGLPPLRDFGDPAHPQNALYNTLKEGFPSGTSAELLAQTTAACYMAGIKQPDDLGNVAGGNGRIMCESTSVFANDAKVDTTQPAPGVQQTMQQVQQFDQNQTQINASAQAQIVQTQTQGPALGGLGH